MRCIKAGQLEGRCTQSPSFLVIRRRSFRSVSWGTKTITSTQEISIPLIVDSIQQARKKKREWRDAGSSTKIGRWKSNTASRGRWGWGDCPIIHTSSIPCVYHSSNPSFDAQPYIFHYALALDLVFSASTSVTDLSLPLSLFMIQTFLRG